MPNVAQHDDFRPAASWQNLRLRARLLERLREFFRARDFLEVETPLLSVDTVVDRHLDPFAIEADQLAGGRGRLWLQTSPEFHMKRMLAAGATSIYQVSRVFRREERGRLHNPEFTMVEWYRVGDRVAEGMQLLEDLCETLLERGPAERLSYREAFQKHVGLDPHGASNAKLVAAVRSKGIAAPESLAVEDRDGWLDLLMAACVQPHLGRAHPLILFDYPASQAALARVRPGDPPLAERFELFVSGVELANGYHELTDPAELRRRNARANARRVADGKSRLPEQSRLLAAMEAGLPECTGVALGFDRLVMVAAGARSVDEVTAFPADRA